MEGALESILESVVLTFVMSWAVVADKCAMVDAYIGSELLQIDRVYKALQLPHLRQLVRNGTVNPRASVGAALDQGDHSRVGRNERSSDDQAVAPISCPPGLPPDSSLCRQVVCYAAHPKRIGNRSIAFTQGLREFPVVPS